MKIHLTALMPSTRACLAVAFGTHLPADSVLEVEVFTAQDLTTAGIRIVEESNGVLAIQARCGAHTLSYGLSVPDNLIQKHVKNLLEESFLRLFVPEGVFTPDADALRRKLLYFRKEL